MFNIGLRVATGAVAAIVLLFGLAPNSKAAPPPQTVTLNPATPNPVTIVSHPYQALSVVPCFQNNACIVPFDPPVPAGQRLVINHVSCGFVNVNASVVVRPFLQLESFGPNQGSVLDFVPVSAASYGLGTAVTVNQDTLAYVEAGLSPRLRFEFGGNISNVAADAACTVSGYFVIAQ
jgi:hypothetical protein